MIIGCSDSNDPNPFASQYMSAPTVPGIWKTDSWGNECGAWGNPSGDPSGFILTYPNPFNPSMTIQVYVDSSIALPAPVVITIVHAYGPYDTPNTVIQSAGGKVIVPDGIPVRTMEFILNPPGIANVVWNGKNDAEELLPSGFYRIYITIGDSLQWGDVLMLYDCSDVPNIPGLDDFCHRH
jgi:hypothetical protein